MGKQLVSDHTRILTWAIYFAMYTIDHQEFVFSVSQNPERKSCHLIAQQECFTDMMTFEPGQILYKVSRDRLVGRALSPTYSPIYNGGK